MDRQTMLQRLRADLARHRLIDPGDRVVLAVSGGPDSMAMLHAMVELNRTDHLGWALHVGHLDHQIRGADAQADADFVAAQARALGIDFTVEREDVPALARSTRKSLEEAARRQRYAFLERICLRTGSKIVATGHQADDQAETVLHHVIRGTGLRGLAGMSVSRSLTVGSSVRLVRPMLGFQREELAGYLDQNGLACRHDHSNASDAYTRNRLRNRVLPLLRDAFNPQVAQALRRLAEQARAVQAHLDATARQTLETLTVSRTDRELVIEADTLLKRSPVVQAEVIRCAVESLWEGSARRGEPIDGELGFDHLRSVVELVANPHSGREVRLPGGTIVCRRYRRLVFRLPDEEPDVPPAAEIHVACPGRTILPARRLELVTDLVEFDYGRWAQRRQGESKSEEWLDYDRLRPPLVVRSCRPGDRFRPLGAPGSKKLSDYFIDAKVPPEQRVRAAILHDQIGPVWVIGHRLDDRVRLRPDTHKALKVQARPR